METKRKDVPIKDPPAIVLDKVLSKVLAKVLAKFLAKVLAAKRCHLGARWAALLRLTMAGLHISTVTRGVP
jgi:hypothetical protein